MKLLIFILIFIFVHPQCYANEIENKIAFGLKRGWKYSIAVVNEKNGKVLFQYHANQKLVPASNQKLITLFQSLKYLGADYQPSMTVLHTGKILNGVLYGDLIIQGNGAIVFTGRYSSDNFKERQNNLAQSVQPLIKLLKQAGIKQIDGKIKAVSGNIANTNTRYVSAVGLLFNENTVETNVENGKLETIPQNQKAVCFKYHRGSLPQKRVSVRKRHIIRDCISIDLNRDSQDYWRIENYNNNVFFINQISGYLRQNHIGIFKKNYPKTDIHFIGSLSGLTIKQMAKAILGFSDNLRAEMLYLYLLHNGKYRLLKRLGAKDGSGLSHLNSLNAFQLVGALRAMSVSWPWVQNCMAKPQKEGTLQHRYLNISGLYAKTGTLDGVISLSGFLEGQNRYIFSILINQVDSKLLARNNIGNILKCIKNNCK